MSTCSSASASAHESARRDNWDDEEVRVLIDLWSDERVQSELESSGRNIAIYRRLAARLARRCGDEHPQRSALACRTKIKALTQAYKKIKDNNNRSGRGRQSSRYFDLMDAVLGTRPTTQPLNYVDTLAMSVQQDDTPHELVVAAEEEVGVMVDVDIEVESDGAGEDQPEASQAPPAAEPTPGCSRDTATPTRGTQPRQRKRKERDVGRYERFLSTIADKFQAGQDAAADRYQDREDRRIQLEIEMEDRRQERELANQAQQRLHQERMLQLLLTIHHPPPPPQ